MLVFYGYSPTVMPIAQVPVVGFVAASGTGKTTLLSQLIPLFNQHGLRIGLIKHSHHAFEIDHPGKDSFRLRKAGATQVMLVSAYRRAIIREFSVPAEPQLDEQLAFFDTSCVDLILVEGFRAAVFPKIELHRAALQQALLYPNDANIIAVAADVPLILPASVCGLNLNQPAQIVDFITGTFFG